MVSPIAAPRINLPSPSLNLASVAPKIASMPPPGALGSTPMPPMKAPVVSTPKPALPLPALSSPSLPVLKPATLPLPPAPAAKPSMPVAPSLNIKPSLTIPIPNAKPGQGTAVPIPLAKPGSGVAVPIPLAKPGQGTTIPISVKPSPSPVFLASTPPQISAPKAPTGGAATLLQGGPIRVTTTPAAPLARPTFSLTDAQKDAATLPGRTQQAQLDFASGKISNSDLLKFAKDTVLSDPQIKAAGTKLFNSLPAPVKTVGGIALFGLNPGSVQRITGNASGAKPTLQVDAVSNGFKLPDARVTLPIRAANPNARLGGLQFQAGGSGNLSINGAFPIGGKRGDTQLTAGGTVGNGAQQYTLGVDSVKPGANPAVDLTRVTGVSAVFQKPAIGNSAVGLTYQNKITNGVEGSGAINAGTAVTGTYAKDAGINLNYGVTNKSGNGWNVGIFGGGQMGVGIQGGLNFRF